MVGLAARLLAGAFVEANDIYCFDNGRAEAEIIAYVAKDRIHVAKLRPDEVASIHTAMGEPLD